MPDIRSLSALRDAEAGCTRCPLYRNATQVVPGEGPRHAQVMLVGEQPGDQEDRQGHPFVGPAGRVLDRAIVDAGIDRQQVFVTNAVKHFKFEPRGKRRIHAKPNAGEIKACRWWIDQEKAIVRPARTILLGTTAIQSQTGKAQSLASLRGRDLILPDGAHARATVHPSFLLRLPDRAKADEEYARFVEDLKAAIA